MSEHETVRMFLAARRDGDRLVAVVPQHGEVRLSERLLPDVSQDDVHVYCIAVTAVGALTPAEEKKLREAEAKDDYSSEPTARVFAAKALEDLDDPDFDDDDDDEFGDCGCDDPDDDEGITVTTTRKVRITPELYAALGRQGEFKQLLEHLVTALKIAEAVE